jgi:hypothetical protein
MKTLLEGIIEGFVREAPMKAVKLDTKRVVTYTNKDSYDAAIKQGTHRAFNPIKDKDLEDEPAGSEDDADAAVASDRQLATLNRQLGQEQPPEDGAEGEDEPSQLGDLDVESRNAANRSLGGPKNRKTIPQPISLDEITEILGDEATKISPAYLEAMVDIINTSGKTKGWLVSDFLERSGAGQPASQAGEILTTLHLALTEEKSSALHQLLTERLITGGKKNPNNKESVVDASWVKAARNNSVAFRRYLDLRHGPGNWSVESVAWDVPDEVKAIGVDYSQTEPSTDTFVKVKTPNGSELEQVSLKKDKKVNFLNLSTGQFEEYVVRAMSEAGEGKYSQLLDKAYARLEKCEEESNNSRKAKCKAKTKKLIESIYDRAFKQLNIPPELSVRTVASRQSAIHREGIQKHSDTMKQMAAKIAGEKCPSETLAKIDRAMGAGQKIVKECKEYQKFFKSVVEHQGDLTLDILQELGKDTKFGGKLSKAQKASIMLSVIAHEEIEGGQEMHNDIYARARDNAFTHSEALMDWSMNSKEGRATIDKAIRERMPIQGVVEGKESMLIGDVHFTKEDAAELFGTDDFSKISERLVSVPGDDPPPPGPRIEYQVKGTEEKFTVANLVSRPDGIGYGGSWRFDLGLDTEFESRLREVNKRRQSSQQPQESAPPELRKLIRDIALWKLGKYGN